MMVKLMCIIVDDQTKRPACIHDDFTGAKVDMQDEDGRNLLHLACMRDHGSIVRALVFCLSLPSRADQPMIVAELPRLVCHSERF